MTPDTGPDHSVIIKPLKPTPEDLIFVAVRPMQADAILAAVRASFGPRPLPEVRYRFPIEFPSE
jgi:hypothetical protein